MSALWHYTHGGQRQSPVSLWQLQRLIDQGELQPADLVWTTGMTAWVKACTVEQLFPAPQDTRISSRAAAPSSFLDDVDKVLASGHGRETAPRLQQRDPSTGGVPMGLLAGGVAMVGFLIGCAVFFFPRAEFNPTPKSSTLNWSLSTNEEESFQIYFHEGHRVRLDVASNGDSDVDLFVYHDQTLIRQDEDFSKSCYLAFDVPKAGYYKVKLWNRVLIPDPESRNGHNSGTLTFAQTEPAAPTEAVAQAEPEIEQPPVQPVAKPVVEQRPEPAPVIPVVEERIVPPVQQAPAPVAEATIHDVLPTGKIKPRTHEVFLTANVAYTIELESETFDPILELRDGQGRRLAINDDIDFAGGNMNSRIVFTPTLSAFYVLSVRSFGLRKGPYQLTVWRGELP